MLTKITIAQAFNHYRRFGSRDYIGESISQIEHACQAAYLAEQDKSSLELIIAAFLHDIGHLIECVNSMNGLGEVNHENIGADYLRDCGFPESVYTPVRNHVKSKRYLIYKNKEYQLSPASVQTLVLQGGVMLSEEANQFEQEPYFKESLQLRIYDDQAKIIDTVTPDIDYYQQLATNLIQCL